MGTPLQELTADRVGRPLMDWLTSERASGKSWADMAYELRSEHRVKVTPERLRQWYAELLANNAPELAETG